MVKKLMISLALLLITGMLALLGLVVYTTKKNDAAARSEARLYASQFTERLSKATMTEIPRLAKTRRVARQGYGIHIVSQSGDKNGATLLFQSISSPYKTPLGYASTTLDRCYRATMRIGRPVVTTELDCPLPQPAASPRA